MNDVSPDTLELADTMVRAAFEIGIMSAIYNGGRTNEQNADWVRDNLNVLLKKHGLYVSGPIGASWGSVRVIR